MPNRTRKDWLQIWFWQMGLVCFVLGCMYYLSQILFRPIPGGNSLPSLDKLTTLFSGASSLALIIFSLLLAFAAIIGWQSLKSDVDEARNRVEAVLQKTEKAAEESQRRVNDFESRITARVSDLEASLTKKFAELGTETKTKTEQIEEELQGRVTAVMGLAIGTLHSDPSAKLQKEEDEPYLLEAIYHSRQAYERLEKLPGNAKYTALNNLVYYSCLLRIEEDRDKLLEYAVELREVGKNSKSQAAIPYLVTYTRAVLAFSSDRNQVRDALGVIKGVISKGGLSKLAEREALFVRESLSARLVSLAG